MSATSFPPPEEADLSMKALLERYPSARRALFSAYHIGGCQSCAFSDESSLAEVCAQNELQPAEVLATIHRSAEEEAKLQVAPLDLKAQLEGSTPPILVDARTREEHEAVALPNSRFLDEKLLGQLSAENPESAIIIYDHSGKLVLDHVSWFRGHGLKRTLALRGGIDAYAKDADSSIPRYRLELD